MTNSPLESEVNVEGDFLMTIYIFVEPRTVTHQEKKIVVNRKTGKPHTYEPAALSDARALYMAHLSKFKPDSPMDGPLSLSVKWVFHHDKAKHVRWRTRKPDTDNLNKLLKDCMTECGYWHDDAQVVAESITKFDTPGPGMIMIELRPVEEVPNE